MSPTDPDQPAEALDAAKVPDEFPERPLGAGRHGTTVDEQREGQDLDGRLTEERPDGRYADDERGLDLLSDYDDAGIDAEPELASSRGEYDDDDSGEPQPPPSAEVAAMHIVDDAPGATDHEVHYDD